MTKGTGSFGRRSLHVQKHECSSCGYPAAKIRKYNWSEKAKRRKTVGTGRTRYLKGVSRKFKNGFQTGQPKSSRPVKTESGDGPQLFRPNIATISIPHSTQVTCQLLIHTRRSKFHCPDSSPPLKNPHAAVRSNVVQKLAGLSDAGPREPHHAADIARRARVQHPQRRHRIRRVRRREHQAGVLALQRRRRLDARQRRVRGHAHYRAVDELISGRMVLAGGESRGTTYAAEGEEEVLQRQAGRRLVGDGQQRVELIDDEDLARCSEVCHGGLELPPDAEQFAAPKKPLLARARRRIPGDQARQAIHEDEPSRSGEGI
ncbi:hypothetical protein AK830_g1449 [Neonectria ditissima]|uniref:60S ribosomal protein L37 n=1 Tax=Neonectria ditissima TaxID=78410 RepID=A0A0P7BWY0_9HYPO|nr:hypothetical protein AK830_g1449 [Neonectria ditissima]